LVAISNSAHSLVMEANLTVTSSSPTTSVPKAAFTVDEFRGAFGNMSRSKFYELVAEGRIRTLKLGRRTLVPATEVPALLDSLKAA